MATQPYSAIHIRFAPRSTPRTLRSRLYAAWLVLQILGGLVLRGCL